MIEQNEILKTMKDVVERFNGLGINYMVTGSFAMAVYLPARTTFDIDIVVEIGSNDAGRIEDSFKGHYYVNASSIVHAAAQKSMFNLISNSTLVKVDCIVKKRVAFEAEKFARRIEAEVAGVKFWVIGKEDLILSKLYWAAGSHSSRQFEDIDRLVGTGIDDGFLSGNIEKIDLRDVWEAFCQRKIRAAK